MGVDENESILETKPKPETGRGRIIVSRHGRPALNRSAGPRLTWQEYQDWWQRYEDGSLAEDQAPAAALVQAVSDVDHVMSSIRPRAIETAKWATGGREPELDDVFNEAPLPPPPWPSWVKLSPRFWGVFSRMYWLNGYTEPGMETREETWARVDTIIQTLQSHAATGDVMVCGHGYLNWMISRRVDAHNWQCAEYRGGNKYWSWRIYEPD